VAEVVVETALAWPGPIDVLVYAVCEARTVT
jgi:hypothetical protein